MKLVTLEHGKLYHIIDESKNCIVAIVSGDPWSAAWVAKQPKTNKILATDQRFEDLKKKMGVA